MSENDQLAEICGELARLIDRLDDLVYDAISRQLHGEDVRSTEKRLSRARNALRRAQAILSPVDEELFDGP